MQKRKSLVEAIDRYENGESTVGEVVKEIFDLTGKTVTEFEINTFRTKTSLDDFCDMLLTLPIKDWQMIGDKEALRLLREILNNLENDAIIERNAEALEKRYAKPTGFISDLIFYSDMEDEEEILEELKKQTSIAL